MKEFKPHMMYKGDKSVKANSLAAHLRLKKQGYGHKAPSYDKGGKTKSKVNEAGNYTKPAMRKRLFNAIKAGTKGGKAGQWSARKAQLLAVRYKKNGGGYTS